MKPSVDMNVLGEAAGVQGGCAAAAAFNWVQNFDGRSKHASFAPSDN